MSASFVSRRLILGALVLFGLDIAASAAPHWRPRAVASANLMRGYTAQPLASDTLRPEERTFLEKAAAVSREQGQLARLAVSQATNSDLRAFAQQLAADQRTISDAIEGARRRKAAMTDPAAPAPELLSEVSQKLASHTGADFDREFVRLLSEAQTATISLFEQAASEIKDTELRELAANHLPTLRAHQNQLVALRKAIE